MREVHLSNVVLLIISFMSRMSAYHILWSLSIGNAHVTNNSGIRNGPLFRGRTWEISFEKNMKDNSIWIYGYRHIGVKSAKKWKKKKMGFVKKKWIMDLVSCNVIGWISLFQLNQCTFRTPPNPEWIEVQYNCSSTILTTYMN